MEIIDIYDETGAKTGVAMEKSEAHRRGFLHKSVCVWIVNSQNEILVQRRSGNVMFPNMLDISFSGHIQSGEDPCEAVIREGKEELGIHVDLHSLTFLFSCRESGSFGDYIENEIDDVFLYRADIRKEQFVFRDQEVQSVEYLPFETFRMKVKSRDQEMIPYKQHYHFLLTVLDGVVEQHP